MSYCRVSEAGMYIYPDGEGVNFMVMPAELGGETYIKDEHLNILLYLMDRRGHELKERIKQGEKLYLEYKKKGERSYGQDRWDNKRRNRSKSI